MADVMGSLLRKTRNAVGDVGGAIGDGVGSAWGEVSGANAARDATRQQLAGAQQGVSAVNTGVRRAQKYLDPYNNPEDQGTLRNMVLGGQFDTQPGGFSQAPYTSTPNFQTPSYANPGALTTNKLGGFGLQGFDPKMPTAPTRQAATTENVNMFMDPGYQFRLQQGMKGLETSAAGRGALKSGATLKALMGLNQDMASQEFGNAYGRFQDNQANARADYQDDRNFASNEVDRMYGRASGDRGFQRGVFQDDRNFGFDKYRDLRNFNRDSYTQDRDFNRGAYEWDTDMSRTLNNDRYNRLADLAGASRSTANAQADLAYQGGQAAGDYYTGMGQTRAAGTLARSQANRQLVGDLFDGGMRLASLYGGGR